MVPCCIASSEFSSSYTLMTPTHLLLELGQLPRQVGHQLHGGFQLLLQVPDLVLLAVAIAADQRHGPHPGEPVQVVLLVGTKGSMMKMIFSPNAILTVLHMKLM